MAKREKKTMEENEMVISSEQQRKFERAARRKIKLENRNFIRGGPHKTAKKDVDELDSNTLSPLELVGIIEEEYLPTEESDWWILSEKSFGMSYDREENG